MTRRPSFNTFELKNLHVVVSRRTSKECTTNPLQRDIDDPAKISAYVHHRGIPSKLLFDNIQVNQTEPTLRTDTYSERIISSNIEWPRNPERMIRCTTSQSPRTAGGRRSNSQDCNCKDRRKRRDPSHHRPRRARSDSRSRSRNYGHSRTHRSRSISPRRSADRSRKRHRH